MSDSTSPSPLQQVLTWPVIRSSLIVAVVVGSILNIINQGDAIFGDGAVNLLKACLTYCVPFCVSMYGAWSATRLRGKT